MMPRHPLIGILLLPIACSTGGDGPGVEWRAALDEVVATERAFAQLATDSTVQFAFTTHIDDAGILFRPGPVNGPAWLEQNPMPAEVRLEWAPAYADVSLDGLLGFTTGPWQSGLRTAPDEVAGYGQYVTLWRRTGSARRAVIDFGVSHGEVSLDPVLDVAPVPAQIPAAYTADGESLRIADEDLSDAASASGGSAWEAYAHETIRWLRNGILPVVGGAVPPAGPSEGQFRTLGAESAGSGDLGYSWGEYRATADAAEAAGHYVRIWRRQPDGSWKVVLDAIGG